MRKKDYWLESNIIDRYSDVEYLIYIIYFHAAATIAGKKTASLISFGDSKRKTMWTWDCYKNYISQNLAVEYCEVKRTDSNVLVLFYNRPQLERRFQLQEIRKFMMNYGYDSFVEKDIFFHLISRFEKGCPHEIGIFLGYPFEDVKKYIENPNEKCALVGYWKVYSNKDQAQATFFLYDCIRNKVVKYLREGYSPMEMKADFMSA